MVGGGEGCSGWQGGEWQRERGVKGRRGVKLGIVREGGGTARKWKGGW